MKRSQPVGVVCLPAVHVQAPLTALPVVLYFMYEFVDRLFYRHLKIFNNEYICNCLQNCIMLLLSRLAVPCRTLITSQVAKLRPTVRSFSFQQLLRLSCFVQLIHHSLG